MNAPDVAKPYAAVLATGLPASGAEPDAIAARYREMRPAIAALYAVLPPAELRICGPTSNEANTL